MTEKDIQQYTNSQELQRIKDKVGTIVMLWKNYRLPQCNRQEGLVAHKEEIIQLLNINLWEDTQRPESAKCIIENISSQDQNWWYMMRKTLQMISELLTLEIAVTEPIEKEKQATLDQLNIAYTKIADIQEYMKNNPTSETDRNRAIKQKFKNLLLHIDTWYEDYYKKIAKNKYMDSIVTWLWNKIPNKRDILSDIHSFTDKDIKRMTKDILPKLTTLIQKQKKSIQS